MSNLSVVLTSRYGNSIPSSLRACRECEAMGCNPVKYHPGDDLQAVNADPCEISPYQRAEIKKKIANGQYQSDGWYFVRCEFCNGTAKIPWSQSLLRIPGWIYKSLRFTFVEAPQFDSGRYLSGVWLGFKCSFLADMGLWRP